MATIERIVIVGSGSSSSTPKLDCAMSGSPCPACKDALANPMSRNRRLNVSLLLQIKPAPAADQPPEEGQDAKLVNVLVDCGKTFREAALRVLAPRRIDSLHSVVLTHDHSDAVLGLDDLREFSSNHDKKGDNVPPIEVYADARTLKSMERVFPYLHSVSKAQSWVASIDWKEFKPMEPFQVAGISIVPLPLEHGRNYICFGFSFTTAIGKVVYLSDVSNIPSETMAALKGPEKPIILILDFLSERVNPAHFGAKEAIAAAKEIGAQHTIFVGMSHSIEYNHWQEKLLEYFPQRNAELGYDGLVVFDAVGEVASS
jgi:phosphoribosyl 1,2-cyclic phosphodiesterase